MKTNNILFCVLVLFLNSIYGNCTSTNQKPIFCSLKMEIKLIKSIKFEREDKGKVKSLFLENGNVYSNYKINNFDYPKIKKQKQLCLSEELFKSSNLDKECVKSLLKVFESRYDSYKNKYANSINTKYKTNSKLDIMNDIVEV